MSNNKISGIHAIGVEVVGVSFDGFFIHLSSSLCSYHFVVVYKMMGGQCFQRFEPI